MIITRTMIVTGKLRAKRVLETSRGLSARMAKDLQAGVQ